MRSRLAFLRQAGEQYFWSLREGMKALPHCGHLRISADRASCDVLTRLMPFASSPVGSMAPGMRRFGALRRFSFSLVSPGERSALHPRLLSARPPGVIPPGHQSPLVAKGNEVGRMSCACPVWRNDAMRWRAQSTVWLDRMRLHQR